MINKLYKKLRALLPRTRKSNPISKLLRPLLEKKRALPTLMTTGAAVGMVMVMAIPSTHAFEYSKAQEMKLVDATEVREVSTKSRFVFPVPDSLGISQNYHTFHHGIDVRANVGSPVISVAAGIVIEVREQIFGYGKHIRIAHDGTVSSLYAHLDEIMVEVGQRVEKGQKIGTIGTTGWVTGPHLHFELLEATHTINPVKIIDTR